MRLITTILMCACALATWAGEAVELTWNGSAFTDGVLCYVVNTEPAGEAAVSGRVGSPVDVVVPAAVVIDGVEHRVTSVGEMALMSCDDLRSVVLPSTIRRIEKGAFCYSPQLESVNVPEGVTFIGMSAFEYCTSIGSLTLPSTLTYIDECAFWNCDGLTRMEVPSSVTYVGPSAFEFCHNLRQVSLPPTLTSLGRQAFSDSGLTSVHLPEALTEVSVGAFSGCTDLTEVVLPQAVTEVAYAAFAGCTSLHTLRIEGSQVHLVHKAFIGTPALRHVYCHGTTPCAADDDAFSAGALSGVTLHVASQEAAGLYASDAVWSQCESIVAGLNMEGIAPPCAHTRVAGARYTIEGVRTPQSRGLYIEGGGKHLR